MSTRRRDNRRTSNQAEAQQRPQIVGMTGAQAPNMRLSSGHNLLGKPPSELHLMTDSGVMEGDAKHVQSVFDCGVGCISS